MHADGAMPARMQRVAVVATLAQSRAALVVVGAAGTVQLDAAEPGWLVPATAGPAALLLRTLPAGPPSTRRVSPARPDLDQLVRGGSDELLAGEAELERVAAVAVVRGELGAWAGWVPTHQLSSLEERLAAVGAAAYRLDAPRGVDPPTLLPRGGAVRSSFAPLVATYATVPYADIDPTFVVAIAYLLMFGMMFGDVGHGLLLVCAGLLLRAGRPRRLAGLSRMWPFVVSAGVTASFFGALYGEFFGPTGVVPVLWLAPLDQPVTLLVAALAAGVVLLAGAYGLGTVNRAREGGWPFALVSASGLAGALVLAGSVAVLAGLTTDRGWLTLVGSAFSVVGLALTYVGFLAAAGRGASGVTEATVELVDSTLRLGTNVVSFARLAAFGLMHAALGLVVWQATTQLWSGGGLLAAGGVLVFVVGQALAFALEALVAGVQALRLSYYELFSRIFATEGQPFHPWSLPVDTGSDTGSDTVPDTVSNPLPRMAGGFP